jgi:hypothetical protein
MSAKLASASRPRRPRPALPVIAELAAGERAGRAGGVAEDGGPEGIVDIDEAERCADMIAEIKAAPVERRRLFGRRRREIMSNGANAERKKKRVRRVMQPRRS